MARTTTYINFVDQTEAAFNFYKEVFGQLTDRFGTRWMFNGPVE